MHTRALAVLTAAAAIVGGACASAHLPQGRLELGPSREALEVAGLGPCGADPRAPVRIDPARPLVLLVHGCNSSAARFATLAQVFEHQGQQTVCFSYDDRDRLRTSARQLREALAVLGPKLASRRLTLLGHSQGGLVSRRALVREAGEPAPPQDLEVRLVTVSSPFAGIESSSHCGSVLAHVLTFGITTGVCQLITGAKWTEIPPGSGLVRAPGTLLPGVGEHLRIATDERGTCRVRAPEGGCEEDDFVFSLEEQRSPPVDGEACVQKLEIKAGHAEIVGETGQPPHKLIETLQEHGVLAPVRATEREAFAARLAELYR